MEFALVQIVAGHLASLLGTSCWAQESWEMAGGAGSNYQGLRGYRKARVLWGSGNSGPPRAYSCAAEVTPNSLNGLPSGLDYTRLGRP